jgi:hypothetical protein
MRKRLVGSILLAAAVVAIVGVGFATLVTTATPANAARCICPLVYAPVICDHGKTYPNQCVADCRHAKNCVPTGVL